MPYRRVVDSVGDTGAWALFMCLEPLRSQAQVKREELRVKPTNPAQETQALHSLRLTLNFLGRPPPNLPGDVGTGSRLRSLVP